LGRANPHQAKRQAQPTTAFEAAQKERLKTQEVFPAVRSKSHRDHLADCR
jgi:hypothetical protein